LLAYLTPLITLIGGAGAATAFATPEWVVALAGLAGLGIGLWIAGILTGGWNARARYRPVLVRRLGDVAVPLATAPFATRGKPIGGAAGAGPFDVTGPSATPAARGQ
jgi:hypothetical protein